MAMTTQSTWSVAKQASSEGAASRLPEPTAIYFDSTDGSQASTQYCINQLEQEIIKDQNTYSVDDPADADLIHFNTIPFRRRDLPKVLSKTPAIATQHGGYQWWAKRRALLRRPEHRILYLLRSIFRASQHTVEQIGFSTMYTRDLAVDVGGISSHRTQIIPLGRNENFAPISPTDTDDPFILVVINNHNPRKNVQTILKTMRELPHVRFVLPGKMWPDFSGELPANADIVGYVSEAELIDYYNRATALYLPTLYEGFGLPFVEAMACETAVVTNPCGAALELCGNAALYVDDPVDAPAHAELLQRLVDDADLRRQYESRGPMQAAPYTWERTASSYLDLYNQVLYE